MAARRLADLRLDLLADDRTRAGFEQVCDARPAVPSRGVGIGSADLLLVESGSGARQEEIAEAAEAARQAARPAAIWLTRDEDVRGFPATLLARFDGVFVTDNLAVKVLSGRVERPVRILPLAISAGPVAAPVAGDRVGYVGGFSSAWPKSSQALAEALLDAALPYGLEVLAQPADGLADLPERFRERVRDEDLLDRSSDALRACRTLIVFVPEGRVPSVPAIALDALAMGVRVVMRSSDAWQLVPPTLITYPIRPDQAAEAVAWCMSQGDRQAERSRAGRAAVLNTHTFQARLATVASAFGMAVLPSAAHA